MSKKTPRRPPAAPGGTPPVSDEDRALFRDATRGVQPLPDRRQAALARPRPAPRRKSWPGEAPAPDAPYSDHVPWALAADLDQSYARPGVPRQTLRKMRGGALPPQAELDLHGLTSEEARAETARFLSDCLRRRLRCVRIIHGKGLRSPNQEPVLKQKVRAWLAQHDAVLAWCAPREASGGALLVLLRAG